MRVIGPAGENFGVIPLKDALAKAQELGLDLVEISPSAVPPIAKITDFGKYQYDEKKKQKVAKAKVKTIDTKSLQVKIGTDEHDLQLKAAKASEWLKEGHRIKIDLFITGRAKYMDFNFLNERLDRILKLITEKYKVAENPKKGLKGLTTRRGKIIGRKAGQNHFNSKESRRSQLAKKRTLNVKFSNKAKARFLVGA
jgi:translation initiation factor IF-3